MTAIATAFVRLRPDSSGLAAETRSSTAKAFGSLGSHWKTLGKTSGVAVAGGFAVGVAALGKVLKSGFGEVKDAQAGFAQLNAGIKSTGGIARISAATMENLASSIQAYSGQTDDSIVQTEALLLTFTNIRNAAGKNNDIFTQTTKIAADMAARLGGDASGAAIQLGKALNDPVKGITALTRAGVSFSDAQRKQIKALVESGNTLGAQKVILAELNKEFGGSAKAFGQTLPGQIERAKRAFEDFAQGAVAKLIPLLTRVVGSLREHVFPVLGTVAGAVRALAGAFTGHLGHSLDRFSGDTGRRFIEVGSKLRMVFDAISHAVRSAVPHVQALAARAWPVLVSTAKSLVASVRNLVIAFTPTLQEALRVAGTAGGALAATMQRIGSVLEPVTRFVRDHKTALQALVVTVGTAIAVGKAYAVVSTIIAQRQMLLAVATGRAMFAQEGLTVAQRLAAASGKVFAAVQTAINVVMSANPIGIVVVALAALGAGFVYAYKHSEKFRNVVQAVMKVVREQIETVVDTAGKIVHAFAVAVHAVKAIPGKVLDAFQNAPTLLLEAGKNIVLGLIRGIIDKAGDLIQAIKEHITDKLPSFVKKALGISSPSKVFRAIGGHVMDGLIQGLRAKEGALSAQLGRVTDRLTSIREAAASLASSVRDTITGGAELTNTPDQTVAGITTFLRGQLAADRAFQSGLASLSKLGLGKGLISQLAQAGPESAGNIVANLSHASRGDLAQITALQSRINATAKATGQFAAREVYSPQLEALRKQQRELIAAVHQVGRDVAAALDHTAHQAKTRARTATKARP